MSDIVRVINLKTGDIKTVEVNMNLYNHFKSKEFKENYRLICPSPECNCGMTLALRERYNVYAKQYNNFEGHVPGCKYYRPGDGKGGGTPITTKYKFDDKDIFEGDIDVPLPPIDNTKRTRGGGGGHNGGNGPKPYRPGGNRPRKGVEKNFKNAREICDFVLKKNKPEKLFTTYITIDETDVRLADITISDSNFKYNHSENHKDLSGKKVLLEPGPVDLNKTKDWITSTDDNPCIVMREPRGENSIDAKYENYFVVYFTSKKTYELFHKYFVIERSTEEKTAKFVEKFGFYPSRKSVVIYADWRFDKSLSNDKRRVYVATLNNQQFFQHIQRYLV